MCRIVWLCLALLLLSMGQAYAADAPNLSGFRHSLKAPSVTCKDCHGEATPTTAAKSKACNGCHGDLLNKYKPRTLKQGSHEITLNVHDSHYGDVDCLACHKIHGQGKLMCNECHKWDIEVK